MIVEIVTFDLPAGMERAEIEALYQSTRPRWQGREALDRKYYLIDEERGVGGGVYVWDNVEAAKQAHDAAWCDMAERLYGSRPLFQYFDIPMMVDNSRL